MSKLRVKAAGILLILLALSMDFTPHLLTIRVLAQESFEDFLSRLEGYLSDAIPPEAALIEECEYIIPDGFNASYAEMLWRDVGSVVSMGGSRENITSTLQKAACNSLQGNGVLLNISNPKVEKRGDGSVRVKIPVVSSEPLNYTHYNSTNVSILYETWNETLVKFYSVRNLTTLLNVTYRSLETNETLTRLIKPFLNASAMLGGNTVTHGLGLNVTVPEHSQELATVVPEYVREFTVLFPKYRIKVEVLEPVKLPNGSSWLADPSWWRPSFPIGSEVTITVCGIPNDPDAGYPYSKWIKEPLDAIVRIGSCEGFQVIGYDALHLTTFQPWGHFTLRAVEPGNHSIVLEAEGNAVFQDGSKAYDLPIKVLGSEHPCIEISILGVNGSTPGFVKLTFRVRNTGGSATKAWFFPTYIDWYTQLLDVLPSLWGWGPSYYLGVLPPGESVNYTYTCLLAKHAIVEVIILYGYPAGILVSNTYLYLNYAPPWVMWEDYLIAIPEYRDVPEHYDKLLAMIPVHEEKLNVTIPGYTCLMRIRLQSLGVNTFENMIRSMLNRENMTASFLLGETLLEGTIAPLSLTLPVLGIELEQGEKKPGEDVAKYVMERVEPLYGDSLLLSEDELCRLLGVSRSLLRRGIMPAEFNITFAYETWVNSSKILLNVTQFAAYNRTINDYIRENNLQGDLKIRWNKLTNATRFSEPSGEKGFLTLIYRPLATKGNGPLKSIQVRNYSGYNLSYRLKVSRYNILGYMPPLGQPLPPSIWENFSSPFRVTSLGDSVILASSLASNGYSHRVQLLYGSSVVAEAFFDLYPEPSPFWTGFWVGIREKAWGIILTTAILVVLAIPTGGGSLLAEAKAFLTSTLIPALMAVGVAANIMEIVEAYWAYDRMGKVANVLDNFSSRAMGNGYENSSSFFRSLGNKVRDSQNLIVGNTALDLLADLTVRDLFIAFGRENATEYEKGKAIGRVVGAALSFVVYASTYYRLFTEGPKLLSWQGKIKSFLRGVYNWVTPPLWDFGVTMGRFAVKEVAASLTLSEQNQRFKEYLNLIREDEASLSSAVGFTGKYLDNALDFSGRLGLSEKAFLSLLWVYGNGRMKLGDEAWSKFLNGIQDIGGDSRKCADEFLRWLYNAEDPIKIEQAVLEVTPRLTGLSTGELENMGKALAKVGDSFENGFKLFDTYFKTIELEQYGRGLANALAEAVSKNVEMLNIWSRAIDEGYPIYFREAPNTYLVPAPEDQSKIQGKVVYVYVLDQNTKDIITEGSRKLRPEGQKDFKFGKSSIKSGDELLILINKFTVEDFYNKYAVKDKIVIEDGNAYYVDINGKALKQLGPGVLDGYLDETYIDFQFKDLKGKAELEDVPEYRLRVSDSGYQMLIDSSGERNAVGRAELKTVKDDSSKIVAELLFVQTPEGPLRGIYLLSRSLPEGWKWCLRNEENVVPLESGQVKISIEDLFWRILDLQTYERLKVGLDNARVRVSAVFDTPSGKVARWTGSPNLNFMVPEEATALSKLYIVWADGFKYGVGDAIFKLSGGNVEICSSEDSITLQADYRLSLPTTGRTTLMVNLPFSGNFKPAFDICVDDSGNLVAKPTLKYVLQGEIQNSWDVSKYEYQQTYYITKGLQLDQVLIAYKEDGEKKVIGLTRLLPGDIEDIEHFIAVLHGEDYIEKMGGRIISCEVKDPQVGRIIDIVAEIKNEKVILEVKTGVEKSLGEGASEQPEKDIKLLLGKGKEKYEKAYYFFNEKPSGEGAIEYLKIIRRVYGEYPEVTGKVFIIIGENGNPVPPTDPSLDSYINK
ncbi:MAG: hypothetical protein QXF52_02445 [Thermoproteota archaeon]